MASDALYEDPFLYLTNLSKEIDGYNRADQIAFVDRTLSEITHLDETAIPLFVNSLSLNCLAIHIKMAEEYNHLVNDFTFQLNTGSVIEVKSNPELQFRWDLYNNVAVRGYYPHLKDYEHCNINDNQDLEKLTQRYHEITKAIFFHFLKVQIVTYLSKYLQDLKSPKVLVPYLDTHALYRDAILQFKNHIFREILCQFETICMVERCAFLQKRFQSEHGDIAHNFISTRHEIKPEIDFLQKKLLSPDRQSFKLDATKELMCEIGNLDQLSQKTLPRDLQAFFIRQGNQNIDSELAELHLTDPECKLKERKTSLYFNNTQPGYTNALTFISEGIVEIETILQSVKSTAENTETQAVETMDTKLMQLRAHMSAYREKLDHIVRIETYFYNQRSKDCLEKREMILSQMEKAVYSANELTPSLRLQVKKWVTEIKDQAPQWSELSLLDKILDIVTAGIHALLRRNLFQKTQRPDAKIFYTLANDDGASSKCTTPIVG